MGKEIKTKIELSFRKKLFFSIIIFLLFLFSAEITCRIFFYISGKDIKKYRFFSRNFLSQRTFYGNTYPYLAYTLVPGMDALYTQNSLLKKNPIETKFHINSLGFRGKEISINKPANTYRIFCIGGSSTFGVNISDPLSWPEQLENLLKNNYPEINFEVINGGVPAYCSSDSLIVFLLRALELNPDAITIMDGINDQHFWGAANFRSDYSHGRVHLEFKKTIFNYLPYSFFKSYIYSWICFRVLYSMGHANIIEMTDIKYPKITDKSDGLKTLYRNIENLIVVAKYRKTDILLSTFPFYSDKKNTPWIEPHYAAFQSTVNDLLRKLSSDQKVILVDNASLVPKDISYFTDNFHFTDKGESAVARNYFNAIIENDMVRKKIKSVNSRTLSYENQQ